jgi:hypothetical protein
MTQEWANRTGTGPGGGGRCPFGFDSLAAAADDMLQVMLCVLVGVRVEMRSE